MTERLRVILSRGLKNSCEICNELKRASNLNKIFHHFDFDKFKKFLRRDFASFIKASFGILHEIFLKI